MSRLDALEGQLAPLATRLTDLEKRPISEGVSEQAVAAYEAELARLQESLKAQRAEVEQMVADARELDAASKEAARIASAQTVLTQLKAALNNGQGIGAALAELQGLGVTAPDDLSAAADGVATLPSLIADFAPAARNALAASRSETAGSGDLLSYVTRQLGARSVTPREGDDPDAVLSRAEAAVVDGQLDAALAEIAALPDTARAEMAGWEAAATKRLSAMRAAETLAQSLNSK
jgi:hypothetical protein